MPSSLSSFSLHFYALHLQSYRNHVKEISGNLKDPARVNFGSSQKDRYFLKIPKWKHKLVRDYERGKLVSYFLNNADKTCLYELKISENIDIEHVFQSKPFFHLSSNLHTSFLSVFSKDKVCPKHFILTLNRGPGPFCLREILFLNAPTVVALQCQIVL